MVVSHPRPSLLPPLLRPECTLEMPTTRAKTRTHASQVPSAPVNYRSTKVRHTRSVRRQHCRECLRLFCKMLVHLLLACPVTQQNIPLSYSLNFRRVSRKRLWFAARSHAYRATGHVSIPSAPQANFTRVMLICLKQKSVAHPKAKKYSHLRDQCGSLTCEPLDGRTLRISKSRKEVFKN